MEMVNIFLNDNLN